jgi:hypothetical protein
MHQNSRKLKPRTVRVASREHVEFRNGAEGTSPPDIVDIFSEKLDFGSHFWGWVDAGGGPKI